MRIRSPLATRFLPLPLLLSLLLYAVSLCGPTAAVAAGSGAAASPAITPLFRPFFDANGGDEAFGAPLSGALIEVGRRVQYFERARFEHHPEFAGTPNEIMLGLLGRALTVGRDFAPGAPNGRDAYFPETGHTLGQGFLAYWHQHNGLRILGYPISEEFAERNAEDGRLQTVQYFERGRLAWDAARGRVEPGRVGAEWLGRLTSNQAAPPETQGAAISTAEQRALAVLLEARRATGAPEPQLDPALIALARERSTDMANRNYFSHVTPEGINVFQMLNGKGIPWGTAGEIIARNNAGASETASLAAQSFLNSPGHRAVVVDPQYNYVGIGHAVDGNGMHYFTLIFVRR